MRNWVKISLLSFLCFGFVTSEFSQGASPYIELFTPTGSVKSPKQITARFSQPMVSFGEVRPGLKPFQVDCPFTGTERFIDPSTWVYEFEKPLPGGVICTFELNSGVKTLKGESITGEKEFVLDTGGPSVRYSTPYSGSEINEDQIFVLKLDAKPDLKSVKQFAYFRSEELGNRIASEIVEGDLKEKILYANGYDEPDTVVLLKAKQVFIPARKIQLVWGKGIVSEWGGALKEDQVFNFTVRPMFSARMSCERVNAKSDCIPILPISLNFSSPVSIKLLKKIKLVSKDGKEYPFSPFAEKDDSFVDWVSFPGPFPENTEFKIQIPNLEDETNRSLVNKDSFPLTVKTAEFPPLAKFSAKFGILESKAYPAIPVTLRNLELSLPVKTASLNVSGSSQKTLDILEIQKWFQIIGSSEREKSIFAKPPSGSKVNGINLPKPNGKKPMEVVGIPLEKPGFYVVEIGSDVLGQSLLEEKGRMYVASSALVTNLSTHFKWGKDTSLVWVTSLDKGLPEPDVQVKILDCKGNLRAAGITGKNGTMLFGNINFKDVPYCGYYELGSGLTVFAQKNDDISFTSSQWNNGIESWRFQLPQTTAGYGSELQTIVLDRTLLKKGETLHLKHFRRSFGNLGLNPSDPNQYPKTVVIRHEGSGETYDKNLVWSFPGHTESDFKIPNTAKHGLYSVYYPTSDDDDYGVVLAQFRVEEFRLPVLKGNIQLLGGKVSLISPKEAEVGFGLEYLSGGGAGSFPVSLRTQVSSSSFSPKEEYSQFSFDPTPVLPGKVRLSGYDEEQVSESNREVTSLKTKMDEKGFLQHTFQGIKKTKGYSNFLVEMEYSDPSGEIQTVSRNFPIYSGNLHLGMLPDGWMFTEESVKLQMLVLDLNQKPVANQKLKVAAFKRDYYSNRKRLVGGFYSYEHYEEVSKLGDFCEGKTDAKGILTCEQKSPGSGEIVFVAETKDENGNQIFSQYNVWVSSKEDMWFDVTDHNRMDILPEKRSVEVGETVKVQIKSPFREATALVSLEREGVIDSFVTTVSGKNPVIQIPIKKEYVPNVYVSVLLVRGRVGDPKPTGLVDLAKPSYRLGLVMLKVGAKPYALDVKLATNKNLYEVRETVNLNVEVKDIYGKVPDSQTEVTLAVVDEALLELSPNPTWNVLDQMMGTRPLLVNTSTASSQIIGKRHFGLKAKPEGGGGGKQSTRSLFETLVLWKGKVLLDKDGKTKIQFKLNDSLTSFRIVAIASSGSKHFGTGFANIQTNQEFQTFASIPPVVREGDQVKHTFSIRNAGNRNANLNVSVSIKDDYGNKEETKNLDVQSLSLDGNTSGSVDFDLNIPDGVKKREFTVSIKDEKGKQVDKILTTQNVLPFIVERVYQGGLFQYEAPWKERAKSPEGSQPGSGRMEWRASASILTSVSGIETYFRAYPYSCIEQRLSKAIGLRNDTIWNDTMADLPGHLDQFGFVKYFSKMDAGSEILTAYILTTASLANKKIPEESFYQMTTALQGFLDGRFRGETFQFGADLVLRKIIVWEALTRYQKYDWDKVRPVFENLELLPTASLIDLMEIYHRVNGPDERIKPRLANILRSRLNLQGTELSIADKNFQSPWWIMGSKDYTMAKLLLWTFSDPSYKKDLPRLIKTFLKMQKNASFDTTLANAYAILVMDRIAKNLESEKVSDGNVNIQSLGKSYSLEPNGKRILSIPLSDKGADLSLEYAGKGKPWIEWQVKSKLPLKEPISSGYRLKRSVEVVKAAKKGQLTKGDTIRVKLQIIADSPKTWVVLEDPMPPGSLPLGRGFGRESAILSGESQGEGSYYLSFEEKTLSTYRAYFQYLPEGTHNIEYSYRLNHTGLFQLPQTRVEAMYSPETHAEFPNEVVRISEEGN
ncbi:MG2 domain-containing protein [Leptospira sp. 96542]|nr:MG2 domain-containing protein [Leptospira sp. 96542]